MRSPFGIFRKHGTILTAGLVVLCMFAFTLADFLKPQHLPMLLGMAAFAMIFYLFGQPSGKGSVYAVVGAVVGLVVVLMVPSFFKPAPAATTSVGSLSDAELRKMIDQRRQANQFVQKVVGTGLPTLDQYIEQIQPGFANTKPEMRPFYYQVFQPRYESFVSSRAANFAFAPDRENLDAARVATVREWVMAREADEIGIRVSDRAVTDYLQKASNGSLTREQFTDMRKELAMSEADLYDMLRYHIKARQYLLLTFPSPMIPPEQQWDYYMRATVRQDMELAKIPVKDFTGQIPDPNDAELSAFYDQYKNREPQGIITRDEGWIEPVELMTPEPAFREPRTIKLAYVTARIPAYEPTEKEIAEYYEKHKQDYPNPAFSQSFDYLIPEPVTPGGPAVAQKPKTINEAPAWAEKLEFLTLHQAKDQVRGDMIFAAQQRAREKNDGLISKALAKMNDLGLLYQSEGENHKTAQEISDELKAYAEENGLEYTVPPSAWTPPEMTATKIGQAVEVEINSNPLPGQMRASVMTGGANVVYLAFRMSNPEDLYRPTQVISRNEVDTRYVYWKIEDHAPQSPDWADLSEEKRSAVKQAWKISKAREFAEKRATGLADAVKAHAAKQPKDAQDNDLFGTLEELKDKTVTGKEGGPELIVSPAFGIQWMTPGNQQSGPRIGAVLGVPKAGEKFMEAAFHNFEDVGDVGVLVNADATEYYVGKLLDRQYGEGNSIESLREAFLNQSGTPALQTVNELVYQQNQELFQKWRQQFDEKFQIQLPLPEEPSE